ncbi:MAG: hypothetical protein ACTHJL_14510 [Amnibacterium sp.]
MKMRVAASVALAGLIVLGASGCEFISPQDTTQINQVADGLDANVGDVAVRDALLFTANGTEASLVATFVNSGSGSATVSMQYTTTAGPQTQQVTVPANGSISVRPGAQASVTLSGISAKAGSLFPVFFTSGGHQAMVKVPVLNATLPGYETLTPTPTPTPVAPSPTPSSSTGAPTPTPTASATPAA